MSQEEFVFFYPVKKPFDWKTLSDLAPYKLGGVLAYSYGKELDALLDSGVLTMERDGLAAKNLENSLKAESIWYQRKTYWLLPHQPTNSTFARFDHPPPHTFSH